MFRGLIVLVDLADLVILAIGVIVGTGWHLISPMVNSPRRRREEEEYPKYPLQKSTNPLRVGNALEDLNLSRPSRSGASSKWLAPRVTAPTGQLLHAVCPSSSLSTGMLVNSKGCQQGGLDRNAHALDGPKDGPKDCTHWD